jgi:hypothetical protein
MPIVKTDFKFYYSGAGKNAAGGPQGGIISSVQIPQQDLEGGVIIGNTIFPDITTQQAATGFTDYACIYVKNTHASQTATSIKIWQSGITPGGDTIRFGYSGVAANGHDPLLTETNTPVYKVPLSTSVSHLNDTRFRAGMYVANPFAPIYNKAITLVELYLQRFGTPTGTLNVRQRNRNSETIRVSYGSIDVSTINNSTPTLYQFSAPGSTYKTPLEGIIAAEYTGGTATNYITVYRKAGSPVPFMHLVNYSSQWNNVSDFDLCGNMFVAGTAGDTIKPAVTFENPVNRDTAISLPNLANGAFVPIWFERKVPANSPNYNDNTSELALEFLSPD